MGGTACFDVGRTTDFSIGKNTYCVLFHVGIKLDESLQQPLKGEKNR
jgi:hypothetical protein